MKSTVYFEFTHMANCRNLKKDIKFLYEQVVNECYSYMEYSSSIHYEDVLEIIADAQNLRNDLLKRVNLYKNNNEHNTSLKPYFHKIVDDMVTKNTTLIDRLNAL